jgi:hypothetical protein
MLGYDLYTYFFPAKTYAAGALRRGELPLWNPDLFLGAPFLANVQMAVLYPPDLLFAFLEFPPAVAISQWLHLALAGAGMYALCRWGWGLDPLAGLIGALAFAGGGFFGAHMGHLNQVHASAWLPWVALCTLRLARSLGEAVSGPEGRRRGLARATLWLVAGGAVVALQLTAGHTQEAYYSLLAVGLLGAGYTAFPPARAPVRWAHLLAVGAVALNGALLAAAQLLPALELSRSSYRQGGIPLPEATGLAVERTYILESLLPTFWSLPSQEVTGYVGVVALPLALVAFVLSPARRTVLLLGGLALLGVTLALGAYTPLYAVLYEVVPLFDSFRAPGRWLLVSSFALAGLAAHGAGALRPARGPRGAGAAERETSTLRYGVALSVAAGGLLFFLWRSNDVGAIQWLPQPRAAVLWGAATMASVSLGLVSLFAPWGWPRLLLAAGLALELSAAAREMEYNRPGDPELYRQRPAIAAYLEAGVRQGGREAPVPERVVSLAVEERLDPERLRRAAPREDGEYRHYAAMREAVKPSLGLAYGLPTIDGYDGGLLPTRDYARFKSLLVPAQAPVAHYTLPPQAEGKADSALLGALNVRYVLSDGRNGSPGPGWTLRESAPGAAWLYENEGQRVLPRAWLVDRIIPAPEAEEAALERLASLDLAREALVHLPPDDLPPGLAPERPGLAQASEGATRTARITRYSAGALEIETVADGAALLVVSDSYYPGWRAAVDGRPVPLLRTNVILRGVPVPAGRHQVRLWFDPLSVRLGFALSALALVANGAALAWVANLRSMKRRRAPAP